LLGFLKGSQEAIIAMALKRNWAGDFKKEKGMPIDYEDAYLVLTQKISKLRNEVELLRNKVFNLKKENLELRRKHKALHI